MSPDEDLPARLEPDQGEVFLPLLLELIAFFFSETFPRKMPCYNTTVRIATPHLTGWMWQGHGGDTVPLPTSDVHTYVERVDKDMHFSGGQCSRNTEEVGASQMLCRNPDCGVITWHLSRK